MNFLAHSLLGNNNWGLEVGGIMGDFVHGKPDPALPADLRRGILLHRAVDSYTDQHPQVLAAKALFMPPWRRYAGIMLDVWFDYYLAREFETWSALPLDTFSQRLQQRLDSCDMWLSPGLRRFAGWMRQHDAPASYQYTSVIDAVFDGISARLSRSNPLADALPVLLAQDALLKQHFDVFFPQLVTFARQWRALHDAHDA